MRVNYYKKENAFYYNLWGHPTKEKEEEKKEGRSVQRPHTHFGEDL